MITDIFFMISVIGLILLVLLKLYNLVEEKKIYGVKGALFGFGLCFLLWFFMLTAFTASITNTETSTITGAPSGTITVEDKDNAYVSFLPFMNLVNVLFLLCVFLSFAEIIQGTGPAILGPRAGPRAEKYRL